jgi:IstB-like ATP binding protein
MTTAPGERLPYLLRALKAPRILDRLQATAERARAEGWPYEQFLEALGDAEVFAREASGARQRIRAAGFPAPKTLEDFDFAANPGAERPLITHLAQLAWIEEAATVCLIGPPRHRQTHVATAFGDQGLSGRAPHPVRHRPATGRPPRRRPAPQQPRRRTAPPGPLSAAGSFWRLFWRRAEGCVPGGRALADGEESGARRFGSPVCG